MANGLEVFGRVESCFCEMIEQSLADFSGFERKGCTTAYFNRRCHRIAGDVAYCQLSRSTSALTNRMAYTAGASLLRPTVKKLKEIS